MSTTLQIQKIKFLNDSIAHSKAFGTASPESTLVLPTGDGMAIGFLQGPERPIMLAMDLHKDLKEYNKGKLPNETIQVRIGIHSGAIFIVKDLKGNDNIWGPGIIMARRIMDIGDEGHILLSSRVADDLRELSNEYMRVLHPLERIAVKHNVAVLVYSAYDNQFGNPKLPKKVKNRINEFMFPIVEVRLSLRNLDTMLVHHKRMYVMQNETYNPTSTITHQIATDVDKTFDELKINVYDENNKGLKISSIELDTLNQKEFATTFSKPLAHGERIKYFLEYEVEEPQRYFENMFFAKCENFDLVFEFPKQITNKGLLIEPMFYEVNHERGTKEPSQVEHSRTEEDNVVRIRWRIPDISKGRCVRLEW